MNSYNNLTLGENDTKLGFNQVRANGPYTLILLNYRYSQTGRIGVNASIEPHSTLPRNGRIPRKSCKEFLSYNGPESECSGSFIMILESAPRP